MAKKFDATYDFLKAQSELPDGSQAITDGTLPEAVTAELNAANIGIGTFLQLVPLLLEVFKNEQLRALISQILGALKPAAG